MIPLAGALLGSMLAAVLAGSALLRLSPMLAAGFTLAASVLLSGALHEDALADCCDGFGGGRDRAVKLAIMRDSRIGAYGACAIVLSLILRGGAIEALFASRSFGQQAVALIVAGALSRTLCTVPLALLPPARTDGVSASLGRMPAWRTVLVAGGSLAAAAAALAATRFGAGHVAAAAILPLLATLAFCRLAHRQIGGVTGDVAGATQQIAEIVILASCAAG